MVQHQMDALFLEPGRLPRLLKGKTAHDVTKTPLDAPAIAALLAEIAPDGELPAAEGADFQYELDGHLFQVTVASEEEAVRATFHLIEGVPEGAGAAARSPEPAAEPEPEAETRSGAEPEMEPELAAEPEPAPDPAPADAAGEDWEDDEELGDPALDERPSRLAAEEIDAAELDPGPAEPGAEPEPAPDLPAAKATPGSSASVVADGGLPELHELLAQMQEARASDLHLSAGQVPKVRVDGSLVDLGELPVAGAGEIERLMKGFVPERSRIELEEHLDADFAIQLDEHARFRVNLFNDRNGISAVLRQIPTGIPTFEELGLPESLRSLAELSKGLVLVTGPTGSGKSTTLAAILDRINAERRDHILTVEDPIEFVYPSKRCLVNQREVGVHAESFQRAVRAALREDPDVVLVGEMRDLETVSMAIETAETGHLVFGTLHTTTAPSTVERVIGQFPGDRQGQIRTMLAGSLRAVVAQALLKKIGGGRVAAFEILIATPAVANLIREGKTFQIASAMQTGRNVGMTTMTESLFGLVERGLVTPAEAYSKAFDKTGLAEKLAAAGHLPSELAAEAD
jgi:twitching motility protein PilT